MVKLPAETRKISCARKGCGYKWKTRSKSRYISCPKCNYNNKITPSPLTRKITCARCKHKWETRSKMGYVTCPNCRYNNKVDDPKTPQLNWMRKKEDKEENANTDLDWMKTKENENVMEPTDGGEAHG